MKYFSFFTATAVFGATLVYSGAIAERAVLNGPCTGKDNAPGVCVVTSECSSSGGTYISNACPDTPDDVKCCTKTQCSGNGNCRWTSSCSGSTISNQCPGPASFKCCVQKATSEAGYPPPTLPLVGACKAKAVKGADIIVKGNPGKVRQIYCTRKCECGKDPSDHCCGMATDMMCSSAGGVRTESGKELAVWVMDHRTELGLKYVIWGQRIWDIRNDKVKPWAQWDYLGDRGSITANHWDHVHVSYM